MKFSSIIAPLALLPSITLAVTLAYDPVYDNAKGSLTTVACSDGVNGLITRGYKTFGDLHHFPHIGAASAVKSWNSPNCGSCWEVTYTNPKGVSKTISMVAIDVATSGFVLSLASMNTLTGGNAVQLGRIEVSSKQVADSVCGI